VARAQHGIYGYAAPSESYYQAVIHWMQKRHGWQIEKDWISTTHGVVQAIYYLIRGFTEPGDGVLLQTPVYHPFFDAITNGEREIVSNPLIYENGRYCMDFADLEEKTRDPNVKLAILCSPHNPVGRVWTREELIQFGEICLKNDILVVSDELHKDLLYKGVEFIPFATLSDKFAQNSVICTGASKTFNLAGLKTSSIIIPNKAIRSQFSKTRAAYGIYGINAFGAAALEAAYTQGDEWLEQLKEYLQGNLDYLTTFVKENIPQIDVVQPEGTYLVWLDCRRLGLDKSKLERLMCDTARVYLDEGYIFGPEGAGFERMNIACPRHILADALDRIKDTVDQLG